MDKLKQLKIDKAGNSSNKEFFVLLANEIATILNLTKMTLSLSCNQFSNIFLVTAVRQLR
jgi:hypothetical protein